MTTAAPSPGSSAESRTAPAADVAISARRVSHRFGDKVALQEHLSLELAKGGSIVGLLGPNGSGKSTLMRLLLGLVPLQKGAVWIDGVPLASDGLAVRRRATYAPGELHLYGELTGARMLAYLVRGRGRSSLKRAKEIAGELGLPLSKRVRGYSHGMKRQLLFAAALAPDVPVRVLDEISEGLDPTKRSEILAMLEEDAASGTTVLLSSHHLGEVDRSCERIVFLNEGRIVADETASEVARHAGRILKLSYSSAHAASQVKIAADAGCDGIETCETDAESGLRIRLSSGDPLEALTALAKNGTLEHPTSIEFGRVSLRELYATLYGSEGT